MAEGYIIRDQAKPHFVTFTVTEWVDIFTKKIYKEVVIESLKYCQQHKGLIVYGYVVMSNHLHLIIQSQKAALSDLIRDMKRHIANKILKLVASEPESRRDWMLKRFEFAANKTDNNVYYKFWRDGNHPEEIYSDEFFYFNLDPFYFILIDSLEKFNFFGSFS